MSTEVIRREKPKPLTDAEKYRILQQYSEGVPVVDIAASVSRDTKAITKLINETMNGITAVRETNTLTTDKNKKVQLAKASSKFITSDFLSLVETNAEMYAYYFAQVGDNKFALIQSGLDVGITKNLRKGTKDYIYRIRGQFLRDIPLVKQIIQEEQDRRIAEYQLQKPQVQMELVQQIEQLKEVVAHDPRQRANLLKAIEMLGRTIGSFTDRVEVDETDAKSGLEILMEKAKGEVYEKKE